MRLSEHPFAEQLYIVDSALQAIEREVAGGSPERGGALLGVRNRPLITEFVFDSDALTTAATYQPSRELAARVKEIEAQRSLRFKGLVHSHPAGLDRPSAQDAYELKVGLELNPHLSVYLAPIVTFGKRALGDHELATENGKISWFAASRTRGGGVALRAQPVREVPLARDSRLLAERFGADIPPDIFVTDFAGAQVLAARVEFASGDELLMIVDELYPVFSPTLLITSAGSTKQLRISWELGIDADRRLLHAVDSVVSGEPPFRQGFGPYPRGPVLSSDSGRGARAGWTPLFESLQVELPSHGERVERQASLAPIDKAARLLILGAGSVGSTAAEYFVRSGIRSLVVIDHELVEAPNLSRSSYEMQDIGRPKVEALERLLLQIDPDLDFHGIQQRFQDCAFSQLCDWVRCSSLVFSATDDPNAQRAANAVAYSLGIPAVFPGLYAGAQGGEVIFTRPEETACLLCSIASRYVVGSDSVEPAHDYGSSRLGGEPALSADIHHLTTAAVKISLSLVADPGSSTSGFVEELVREQMTYLTISMVPRYWFYPSLFREVPNQFAYQSVWLVPDRTSDCPVCGAPEVRTDPSLSISVGPSIDSLRRIASRKSSRSTDKR